MQTYGLAQAVGPVHPSPPHCPHSCASPEDEVPVEVVVVVVIKVVVVVLVVEVIVVVFVVVPVVVVDEPDPVVITKVTAEYAGKVPATFPPLIVADKVAGDETELSM